MIPRLIVEGRRGRWPPLASPETARDLFGIKPEPQWASMPDRSWDTATWVADNRLIRNALGWHPHLTFPEGLRRTAESYAAHPELHDVYEAVAG